MVITFYFSNMNYDGVSGCNKVDLIVPRHSESALHLFSESRSTVKYIFCGIDVHCAALSNIFK